MGDDNEGGNWVMEPYEHGSELYVRLYQHFDEVEKYLQVFLRILRYHQKATDLADSIIQKINDVKSPNSDERPSSYELQMIFCDWHFFFISVNSIEMMVTYLCDETDAHAFQKFKSHFGNKTFESARNFFEHYDERLNEKMPDGENLEGPMKLGSVKDLEFHFEDKDIQIEEAVEEINTLINQLLDDLDRELVEFD